PYANKRYTKLKNEETYEHVFIIHYPFEERPAARPAKTAPCYDRMKALNAVFGQKYGWERTNWFAPKGRQPIEKLSFRRSNAIEPGRAEVAAVRERVGIQDLTGFSKFEASGPGANDFLDRLVANRLPQKHYRIGLAHVLTPKGGIAAEITITRLGPDRFYLISAAAAGRHDFDLLAGTAPSGVTIRDVSLDKGVLVI